MCGLLLKCAALIVMIHAFRLLGRIAGPRLSGLALGLPSTTAVVLVLCGYEHGQSAAIVMAESSLLGLVAAVALPLAYAEAVRLRCKLPAAPAAAVAAYIAVAYAFASFPPEGAAARLAIAVFAILSASWWAKRIPIPTESRAGISMTPRQAMAARTAIPTVYVLALAVGQRLAGPGFMGLLSTFPSMSLVVLAMTHLEAGPADASRIAKVLPVGNSSTLAFLAAFRLASPTLGLAGATIAGYSAALVAVLVIEGHIRMPASLQRSARDAIAIWQSADVAWRTATPAGLRLVVFGSAPHPRGGPRYLTRKIARRRRFAPRVETLAA
jgi:hypothetical protein